MTRPGRFPAVLTDPRVQLGVGMAALLATASTVRHDRVGPREARAFRAVNGLPDSWYRPAWAVMQLGAFGAVPAAAATAWLAGDGELAGRLLADGTSTWASAGTDGQGQRTETPLLLMAESAIGQRAFGRHQAVAVDLSGVNRTLEFPMDLILGYPTIRQADWLFDFPARRWALTS